MVSHYVKPKILQWSNPLSEVINQWYALNMSLDDRNELTENVGAINYLSFRLNYFSI